MGRLKRVWVRTVEKVRVSLFGEIYRGRLRRYIASYRGKTLPQRSDKLVETLAVIIPCYKHAAYMPRMLESLKNQTRLPDEVFLVNDCSPDNTLEVIRAFEKEMQGAHPKIRVVVMDNPENLGQAKSLNNAITAATSEAILILNDDDYLFLDACEVILDILNRYKDVHLFGAHSIHVESDAKLDAHPKRIKEVADLKKANIIVSRPEQVPGYRHYNDINMTHSGSCFLKVAWQAAGGYYSDKWKRVVPFSDRDFQLRLNALYPVAMCYDFPVAFWRNYSSVDSVLNS